MIPSTVFDRVKKHGYMTGSGHAMQGPLDDNAQNTDNSGTGAGSSDDGGLPAPNYRDSDGAESCGDCKNMSPEGECSKFSFQTKPNMVCDGYEPRDDADDGTAGESSATSTDERAL